jgi:predicted ATPase
MNRNRALPLAPETRHASRLVGRAGELRALRQALAGNPALVLVEGEAGIGKTRLLTEALAEQEGALVATCPPLRQPQTLGPIVDALRDAAGQVGQLGLSPLGGALRPLLPEWAADLPAPLEPAEDATAARHRIFRALSELLDRLRIGLLVVEDAHHADDATLELLLFLCSGPARRLCLVVTYRPEDVPARSLLLRLGSLRSSLGGAIRIGLGPLSETETAELVSSMLSAKTVTAEFARLLYQRTDGVPLAS